MTFDRSSQIKKGMYMQGGVFSPSGELIDNRSPPRRPSPKHKPSPVFERKEAAQVADRLSEYKHQHNANMAELTARLQSVREQLDSFRKARK